MIRRLKSRSFLAVIALLGTAVVVVQVATPIVAEAAPGWFEGSIRESDIISCTSITSDVRWFLR